MMRKMKLWIATLVCLALMCALLSEGTLLAASQTLTNGLQFKDTSGNVVHAHGGGMLKVGNYYYWFGENRTDDGKFNGVSCYRSTDLVHWEFRNLILTKDSAQVRSLGA
ncbi:hypothetical protein ACFFK0_23640 [Paenibacillus chartarius]|uniref:Beta-xylosidase n=1 Tax=Paenibacillus chartarius TaxID=747481 RepID=A0ABV6DRW1_9BACL